MPLTSAPGSAVFVKMAFVRSDCSSSCSVVSDHTGCYLTTLLHAVFSLNNAFVQTVFSAVCYIHSLDHDLLLGTQAVCKADISAMLQNEKLVVDEFLEKVAAASRKVPTCPRVLHAITCSSPPYRLQALTSNKYSTCNDTQDLLDCTAELAGSSCLHGPCYKNSVSYWAC